MHFTAADQREPILRFICAQVKQLRAQLKAADVALPPAAALAASSNSQGQSFQSAGGHAAAPAVNRAWKALAGKQVLKAPAASVASGDQVVQPPDFSGQVDKTFSRRSPFDSGTCEPSQSAATGQASPGKPASGVIGTIKAACPSEQDARMAACTDGKPARAIEVTGQVCTRFGTWCGCTMPCDGRQFVRAVHLLCVRLQGETLQCLLFFHRGAILCY